MQNRKWHELAHTERGYINPTYLYYLAMQHAAAKFTCEDIYIGALYKNGGFSYLSTPGGMSRAGSALLKKLEDEPGFLEKIIEANETLIPPMIDAARNLSGDLSTLTDKELFDRWQTWFDAFIELMTYSIVGTVIEMEEPLLSNKLVGILEQKLGENKGKAGEYFQTLTTSPTRTIAAQETIDLLELRLKQLSNEPIDSDIHNHVQSYSWVAFEYAGPGWNEKDIRNRLKDLPNGVDEINQLLNEKKEAETVLERKQRDTEEGLALTEHERYLFHILRVLGFWKFDRKAKNQQAHELMEDFIHEVAERRGITPEQMKMVPHTEMEDVIVRRQVDSERLKERLKESFVLHANGHVEVFEGKKSEKIFEHVRQCLHVDADDTNELRGSTAYPGIARGKVKKVDIPSDMEKMEEGDILVSRATSPHILAAMKKAAAIVTDSGGITCHAAIVARELKKPTVIGTKIASKVLQDGDYAIVDASSGTVEKINEKQL